MNGFIETVHEMRNGASAAELEETLARVVAAVRATGRAGSLTYTIAIAPASRGDAETLIVRDRIACKVPELERSATVFFPTEANGLSRQNARQPELGGFREVPAPIAEVREVGASVGDAAVRMVAAPVGETGIEIRAERVGGER